ncbi:MAG: right-handed parallel beta-helix repeat-containing protein [Longimicrobiaceae bacterium]
MKAPVRSFIIRGPTGIREAHTLVLGQGLRVTETAGGLPELESTAAGDPPLMPGDDIQAALATGRDVRLGPGTFHINYPLVVGANGRGQRLSGSGIDIGNAAGRTVLYTTSYSPAIRIQSRGSVVEGFMLGGSFGPNVAGIRADSVSDITLRNLIITGQAEWGIRLEGVSGCEISNVIVSATRTYGIYARGLQNAKLWNLLLEGCDTGLYVEDGSGVACESVSAVECVGYGVRLTGGTGNRLFAVRADNCGTGIAMDGNAGAVVGESLSLVECFRVGILVDHARDVALNACRAVNSNGPLVILDAENVAASAFASQSSRNSFPLHVRVERSTGVVFTGARVVNGATPPTYEVDVSGAGGRVVFIQHNFDPARINSGGNFAAL